MQEVKNYDWEVKEEDYSRISQIIEKHAGKKGALMLILKEVQDLIGFLPREVQSFIARKMNLPLGEIYSTITFYAFFNLKPKGKYQITLCKGTACYVKGSKIIQEKLEEVLGIKPGDTTDDGLFSLELVRCLGACGLGPVMTVNDETFARLKPDRIPAIIEKFREQELKSCREEE
ncbi:MAG: NAD(P)H-dependent oxidoreductase subunit E [Halanaerobium sp.]|nr:NAD(P)H-dependent oxidoreductase subunit E [Halanaerobium sp.]